MLHKALLTLILAGSLGLGCGLGTEDPEGTAPVPQTNTPVPNQPEPNNTEPLAKPLLDLTSIPHETCAKEVGIRGTAPAGASVFAFGGAASSGVSTDAHSANGSFCLPVPLLAGKANEIEIRAQDPERGLSEAVVVTVVQKSCTGGENESFPGTGGTEQATSKNVAFGAPAKAKDNPKEGNAGFLTDEKPSTWVRYQQSLPWYNVCNWCAYEGWVSVKLDKLYEIQKIVVRWRDKAGSGTAYGKEYKVLVSSISDPGDPNIKNGYWETVANVTNGDGGVDTYDLTTKKPYIQHVALWLDQDGLPWTSEGWGMEEFAISEIEVWDAPKAAGPPPPPPGVCQ